MAKKTCSVEGCKGKTKALSYCNKHYHRHRNNKSLIDKPTCLCHCGKISKAKSLCETHYKADWASSVEQKYNGGKSDAEYRGFSWNISLDEYEVLMQNPVCFYCEDSIIKNTGANLDRINNNIGYEIDNILVACGPCNKTRGDRFTVEETKIMISSVQKFKKENLTKINEYDTYAFCSDFYY